MDLKDLHGSFERQTHWDNLRGLIASRLVQSTIVVPVIGYIILFSADLQDYLRIVFDDPDTTTISPRLFWLYFGFCSLALSAIAFNWQCPREVRIHGASFRFVGSELSIMTKPRLRQFNKAIAAEGGEIISLPNSPSDKVSTEIMRTYFECLEKKQPKSRWVVFVLYWFGVALVAVPTVWTFGLVLRAAWRALFGGE